MNTQITRYQIYFIQQPVVLGLALIITIFLSLGFGVLLIAEATAQDTYNPNINAYAKTTTFANDFILEDIFDRSLNDTGLILLDWEGYMANPAIKFFIKPPADATFPATAALTANGTRLYFDLPSEVGTNGPTKIITLIDTSAKIPVYLSIFPDRDTIDENYLLTIRFQDAQNKQKSATINIRVIDQDTNQASPFKITVDFSQDQTGFFDDSQKRDIIQQAADDWAYFIDDMELDTVSAGKENTWILNPNTPPPLTSVTNATPYSGFLLYALGIHTIELNSRGCADGGLQTSYGAPGLLRRSGGIGIETAGDYSTLGWFLTTGDDDWWQSRNHKGVNDLYSVAHHEIGHALIFHPAHTLFGRALERGYLEDPVVLNYQGSYPNIDSGSHFNGAIDQASQRGAFGHEYYGPMAHGRTLITKLDLLTAQAIGYKLRPTSAFIPLSILTESLPPGARFKAYATTIKATGGIPFYDWSIESGALPNGLVLDSFSGTITGIPNEAGTFNFTLRVRDYDRTSSGVSVPLSITVTD
jgi:hypothetical protein